MVPCKSNTRGPVQAPGDFFNFFFIFFLFISVKTFRSNRFSLSLHGGTQVTRIVFKNVGFDGPSSSENIVLISFTFLWDQFRGFRYLVLVLLTVSAGDNYTRYHFIARYRKLVFTYHERLGSCPVSSPEN